MSKVRRSHFLALAAGTIPVLSSLERALAADAPSTVTIAYQPGIAYAALIVMKWQHALEKRFPGSAFKWNILANGDAVRTGIIANQIQFGAGGGGPFLIGWDRGVGYRLVGGLSVFDLWLVSRDPKIKTLKDVKPDMKVGMPSPDSFQAVIFRKGCAEQLGDPHALDSNIVSIPHPLGVAALQNGQIALHLSSPPFQNEEVAAGGHIVMRSYQYFPNATFTSVETSKEIAKQYPALMKGFYEELSAATKFVNSNHAATAKFLEEESQGKVSAAKFERYLDLKGVAYSSVPQGFIEIATFMHQIGMIHKVPSSIDAIELSMLHGMGS